MDLPFAPIVEIGSGRPFNIIAPGDANGDFQGTNERPTVRSDGTLCQTGVDANCLTGIFPSKWQSCTKYGHYARLLFGGHACVA